MIDAVPAMITYLDTKERYLFCNQPYMDMLGRTDDQLLGRSLKEVLGAEAFETLKPRIEAVLSGTPVRFEAEIPFRDGKQRHVSAHYVPDRGPDGTVRGARHTMLNDSDINSTRHARAAVGAVIASVIGQTAVYVSGGAEHQGPPGGGPVAVIARC